MHMPSMILKVSNTFGQSGSDWGPSARRSKVLMRAMKENRMMNLQWKKRSKDFLGTKRVAWVNC